jgi:hypothetical protein
MAFLNNADEPDLDLPTTAELADRDVKRAEADRLFKELPDGMTRELLDTRFADWVKQQRDRLVPWESLRPVAATSNLPLLTVEADDAVFASGDTTKSDTYELHFQQPPEGITAVRLEALPDDRLPAHGPGMTYYEGTKGDFFLGEFILSADGERLKFSEASHSYAKNRFGANPVSAALTLDGDPQTGWSVHGRLGERHTAVYVLEQPLTEVDGLDLKMLFGRHFASSLGRFRISVTTSPTGAQAVDMSEEIEHWLQTPKSEWTGAGRQILWRQFLLSLPEWKDLAAKARKLLELPKYTTTLVMQERPAENPRPTYVHHRGEYLQPTDEVQPQVPGFLPSSPEDAPQNRLQFARWLVSRNNPLTARVTVNRTWSAFFGRGLVPTVEDFGYQGQSPTHPRLLDWLAVEFMNQGWSLKWLHKQIVMSATYRQCSRVTPELLREDPQNALLARGPRHRLEAELIRDAALRVSGLLSDRIGGPSVFPPQPPGITTEGTYGRLEWKASQGEDRYRRSLYTFSKRTAPFAAYNTFDAPTGEVCVARRDASNTPLQALTLMNDIVFVEATQALGAEFADRQGSIQQGLETLFRRILTRPGEREEIETLREFFERERQRFADGELEAAKVAGADGDDVVDRAAWTVTARVLLNLDEAITKR